MPSTLRGDIWLSRGQIHLSLAGVPMVGPGATPDNWCPDSTTSRNFQAAEDPASQHSSPLAELVVVTKPNAAQYGFRTLRRSAKPLAAWAARCGGKRHAAPGESARKPLAAQAARRGGKRRAAPGERPPKLLAAWPEHGECSPHTATSACSAPPSPQQD